MKQIVNGRNNLYSVIGLSGDNLNNALNIAVPNKVYI